MFDAWVEATGRTGRTVLDRKRRRLIRRALDEHPLDDVLDAVVGIMRSPFHVGQNDRGRAYTGLDVILRDAEHIEQFRDLARQAPDGVELGRPAAELTLDERLARMGLTRDEASDDLIEAMGG